MHPLTLEVRVHKFPRLSDGGRKNVEQGAVIGEIKPRNMHQRQGLEDEYRNQR